MLNLAVRNKAIRHPLNVNSFKARTKLYISVKGTIDRIFFLFRHPLELELFVIIRQLFPTTLDIVIHSFLAAVGPSVSITACTVISKRRS